PNGMDDYQRTLFDVLIDRVYRRVGVLVDDPRTWNLSSECTYYTMYEELLDIARDKSSTYENFNRESIDRMKIVLGRYFEKSGSMNYYFRNPISVESVLKDRHMVFSFGMKGQDEAQTDSKSLALRQLFVSYLTML